MSELGLTLSRKLRLQRDNGGLLIAPGCGDALSARLIQAAGFEVAFMSGFWTSGARGLLDVGLINLSEMVQNARYIARSINIPLICDADTGFGDGQLHIQRCVRDFESAGAAGITLEDQTLLKKCGLRDEKTIVPIDTMVMKLRVALASRMDPDFLIVARTDALESEGLGGVLERGRAYLDAGANLLFVEGFRTEGEVRAVAEEFQGSDLVFNQAPHGHGPQIEFAELERLGYSLVIFPAHLVLAALAVQRELLDDIRTLGSCARFEGRMVAVDEFSFLLGEADAAALEASFSEPAMAALTERSPRPGGGP